MLVCQGGQKKRVPKNPVGKKAQGIWGWPGATYVPRRTLNKLLRTATDKTRPFNKTITRV